MRAGKISHLIVFYRKEETQNEIGEIVTKLEKITDWYAQITQLSGNERLLSHQPFAEATTMFRCRFLELTAKDVIKFRDREFNILSINNKEERNTELEIIAKERV